MEKGPSIPIQATLPMVISMLSIFHYAQIAWNIPCVACIGILGPLGDWKKGKVFVFFSTCPKALVYQYKLHMVISMLSIFHYAQIALNLPCVAIIGILGPLGDCKKG